MKKHGEIDKHTLVLLCSKTTCKTVDETLRNCGVQSNAETCRNAYSLAKIGDDAAEYEPLSFVKS